MSEHLILPPGWVEAKDPNSGRKYYANPTTKETRWDPPPHTSVVNGHGMPAGSVGFSTSAGSSSSPADQSITTGNPLYSAPKKNKAMKTPTQLIPMARQMLDKKAAFPEETILSDLELHSITPGQIADLCHIQQQSTTCGDTFAYTPLNPYRMSVTSQKEVIEKGRMDVRQHALKEKLKQFGLKENSFHN